MLTADDLATLSPTWSTAPGQFRIRAVAPDDASAELRIVENALSLTDVEDLAVLASGIADGATRATDAGGFTVDGDTVVVWDGGDNETRTPTTGFAALLRRMVEEALAHRAEADAGDETLAELERLAASLPG